MFFINTIIILGRYKCSCISNMFCSVITSPIIENIHIGCRSCRRTCRSTSGSLYRLRIKAHRTHISTIFSNCIIDSNIFFFPHRIHVLIRSPFIRSYLSNNRTAFTTYMERSIGIIQIRSCTHCCRCCITVLSHLRPSNKFISITRDSRINVYRFIYQNIIICAESI